LSKLILVGGVSAGKGKSVLKTNSVSEGMFPVVGGI
jgi:hypothetical protein